MELESVGCCQSWKAPAGTESDRRSWFSSVPSSSVRLLKGSNNRSVEENKEKSEEKENCSESKEEVGVLVHVVLILW